MSQENVEIVRSLTEAFDARDIEAFVAAHHPNAEVRNLRSQIVGAGGASVAWGPAGSGPINLR